MVRWTQKDRIELALWRELAADLRHRTSVLTAKLIGMLALSSASAAVAISQHWVLAAMFIPAILAAAWGLKPRGMGAFALPTDYKRTPRVTRKEFMRYTKPSNVVLGTMLALVKMSLRLWLVAIGTVALTWVGVHYHEHLAGIWGR